MAELAQTADAAGDVREAPSRAALRELCERLGLVRPRASARPVALALLATLPVLIALRWTLGPVVDAALLVPRLLAGYLVLQPAVEELLFRGIVQGELLARRAGRRRLLGVTAANALTSLLFVAAHLPAHPLLWAVGVLAPALVLGELRERTGSLLPPLLVHALYNAGYLWALTP